MAQAEPLLYTKAVGKSFPGVQALKNVDFRLFPGEVHALMGQNGAGKSTLIKVLTGLYTADSGEIYLGNKLIQPESPQHAQTLGISTVYQEVNLCPNLSVAENMLLGREPRRLGSIDWKKMNRSAADILRERLDMELDTSRELSTYSLAIQQMVAIARALCISAKVLILDEPTSSLDDAEVERLFDVVRSLKKDGIAILFVTHFLDQTYELADRISVLRNGEYIGEYMAADLPKMELISKMIGKAFADAPLEARALEHRADGDAAEQRVLHVEGYGKRGSVAPFDLSFRPGEAIGLAGLLGSGRTEVARLLFGLDHADSGKARVGIDDVSIHSPQKAVELGIAYCPEDRKTEAIFEALSIRENIIIALQARQGLFKYIGTKKQKEIVDKYIKLFDIKTTDGEKLIKNLSGGNQQKAVLSRWMALDPRLLMLDEPTRGIDVQAKAEILRTIDTLCSQGKAVLFISSELEEVVRTSHRIRVMRDRRMVTELPGNSSEESIMNAIAKGEEHAGAR